MPMVFASWFLALENTLENMLEPLEVAGADAEASDPAETPPAAPTPLPFVLMRASTVAGSRCITMP